MQKVHYHFLYFIKIYPIVLYHFYFSQFFYKNNIILSIMTSGFNWKPLSFVSNLYLHFTIILHMFQYLFNV